MAAYAFPDLTASMSPELLRRKQGKSCFNVSRVDEALFAELEQATNASFERYVELAKQVEGERPGARG